MTKKRCLKDLRRAYRGDDKKMDYARLLTMQRDVYLRVINNLKHEEITEKADRDDGKKQLRDYLKEKVGIYLNDAFKNVPLDGDSFYNLTYGSVHYNSHLFLKEKRVRIQIAIGEPSHLALKDEDAEKWENLMGQEIYEKYHIINLLPNHTQIYFQIGDSWKKGLNNTIVINRKALELLENYLKGVSVASFGNNIRGANPLEVDPAFFREGISEGITLFKNMLTESAQKMLDEKNKNKEQFFIRILLVTFGMTLFGKAISNNKLAAGCFIPFRYEQPRLPRLFEIGGIAVGFTKHIEDDALLSWFVQMCRNVIEPLFFLDSKIDLLRGVGEKEHLKDKWTLGIFKKNNDFKVDHEKFREMDSILDKFVGVISSGYILGEKANAKTIYEEAIVPIWRALKLPQKENTEEATKEEETNKYLLPIWKALDLLDTMKYVPGYREHFIH